MRGLALSAVLVLALASWWAFRPQTTDAPGPEAAKTAAPKILRVGVLTLPPEKGYPYNSTGIPTIYTYRAIFDGLTYVTEAGDVQPFLATSWEQIDPLTWRFKLREGVTFSNGAPFTADAVAFAVNYVARPGGEVDSITRELIGLKSAEVESPTSVLIHTKRVEPLLPAALEQLLIVEPETFKALGKEGFAAAPVGTGPFQVVTWEPAKADLVAFKQSWRAPKVDKLEIIALPDTSSRVQAIESGQIDIGVALGYENQVALEQAGARAHVSKTTSTLALTFIFTEMPPGHPLQNKAVRQALNYAVNKEAYIQALFGGVTEPATQPTTVSGFGYNPDLKPYPYDPERAKKMLAEAGFAKGFSFTAKITNGGGAALAEVYQQVAADFARVGVTMQLEVITIPQLIRLAAEGNWKSEAFGMNFSAERTLDALRPVRIHSCLKPNPWFCDKALTAKIEQAYATGDLEARRKLTQEIMAAWHDDAPVVWLHDVVMFEGLSKRVRNYRVDNTVIRYDLIDVAD
ncbi:MAG: ABC transporter substrate-binding protein [Rhodospirillaceae bacterium]|nr:ABC transporter substrate-binding protein [Rhodospirillaceae bacterium]